MARLFFALLSIFAIFAAFLAWLMISMPNAHQITGCMVTQMYQVNLCEKNANYVRLANISKYTKDVIVISEDASFFHHKGFDWFEIKNSLKRNWDEGAYARGGSTITQQLAKNAFLTAEKSIIRKLREAYLAFQIEHLLTKQQILERYLNVVEFGENIYGIKAAAYHYFGKSPADLNILESAFLAYLLPNPKAYSKVYTKGALTDFSRFRILDLNYKMFRYGRITQDQYNAAKEYIDLFPWKNLTEKQIALLSGFGPAPQPFEEVPEMDITSEDESSPIARPTPSDKMLEEIRILESESETNEDYSEPEAQSLQETFDN